MQLMPGRYPCTGLLIPVEGLHVRPNPGDTIEQSERRFQRACARAGSLPHMFRGKFGFFFRLEC